MSKLDVFGNLGRLANSPVLSTGSRLRLSSSIFVGSSDFSTAIATAVKLVVLVDVVSDFGLEIVSSPPLHGHPDPAQAQSKLSAAESSVKVIRLLEV